LFWALTDSSVSRSSRVLLYPLLNPSLGRAATGASDALRCPSWTSRAWVPASRWSARAMARRGDASRSGPGRESAAERVEVHRLILEVVSGLDETASLALLIRARDRSQAAGTPRRQPTAHHEA